MFVNVWSQALRTSFFPGGNEIEVFVTRIESISLVAFYSTGNRLSLSRFTTVNTTL